MRNLADVEVYWTNHAQSFDDEADHGLRDPTVRAAWSERLASWLPSTSGIVVDFGCGTGSLSLLAAELGADVRGIDLSPAMVEIAREKAECAGRAIEFEVGDVSSPSIPGRSVDVVLCRHLLWTLPDPVTTLVRWADLLRDEGRMILIEGMWSTKPVSVGEGEPFPWRGGVSAERLVPQLERFFTHVEHFPLSGTADLWGKEVDDERYAVVAQGRKLR